MKISKIIITMLLINPSQQSHWGDIKRAIDRASDEFVVLGRETRVKISQLDVENISKTSKEIEEKLSVIFENLEKASKNIEGITNDIYWFTNGVRRIISFPAEVSKQILIFASNIITDDYEAETQIHTENSKAQEQLQAQVQVPPKH